jgi:hypothetical protein
MFDNECVDCGADLMEDAGATLEAIDLSVRVFGHYTGKCLMDTEIDVEEADGTIVYRRRIS